MLRRLATIACALGVVAAAAGCSTPKTESGSLAEGKERVAELVVEAADALPDNSRYDPPTLVGTQRCQKTAFGYVVGNTGANRAQVPLIVHTPKTGPSPTELLEDIVAEWDEQGYRIDRTRFDETQFPQLRAHAPGGYEVVATAFTNAPQIDLYAVSPCLRGS